MRKSTTILTAIALSVALSAGAAANSDNTAGNQGCEGGAFANPGEVFGFGRDEYDMNPSELRDAFGFDTLGAGIDASCDDDPDYPNQ